MVFFIQCSYIMSNFKDHLPLRYSVFYAKNKLFSFFRLKKQNKTK